uniref:Retrotransposon gag domain-containing protein n=1 Tax=Tanacetum cinerariifolium TaxID=118510 RepID=A0A6L2MAE8_TANCI|nr:hypothetical protein [Tanacetum cinerariifolium]
MEEINNFQQNPDETPYQAWERFKELLMKCPQQYLMEMQEVILFYNGLEVSTTQILDPKGAIPTKTADDAKDHVKSISTTLEADTSPISRIRSSQYAVSAQQNSKLMFDSRQATISFLSRLNDYYCDKKGLYGPQSLDAYSYGATRIDDSLPRKEKDPGSVTLPCFALKMPMLT